MNPTDLITNPAYMWFPGNIFHQTEPPRQTEQPHPTTPPAPQGKDKGSPTDALIIFGVLIFAVVASFVIVWRK